MHILTFVTILAAGAALAAPSSPVLERRGYRRHDVNRLPQAPIGTMSLCTAKDHEQCTTVHAKDKCITFADSVDFKHLDKAISSVKVGKNTECSLFMTKRCKGDALDPRVVLTTWEKIEWANLQWRKNWPEYNDRIRSVICWEEGGE